MISTATYQVKEHKVQTRDLLPLVGFITQTPVGFDQVDGSAVRSSVGEESLMLVKCTYVGLNTATVPYVYILRSSICFAPLYFFNCCISELYLIAVMYFLW